MKKLIFIILCFVLLMWFFTVDGQAATYSYYFATTGGGSTCSEGSPCATIADCKTKITAADTADTVTCYFAQGDTWTYNSKQVSLADPYGMEIAVSDPETHIDSYNNGGGSAKPKFDGLITDFNDVSVEAHDAGTGPVRWGSFFKVRRSNCSFQNIEITGVYGHGIRTIGEGSQGLHVKDCLFTLFGTAGVSVDSPTGAATGNIIENSTFHTGQQLNRYAKSGSSWTAAIQILNGTDAYSNNKARYNVVYDIYGEGINVLNGEVTYNLIGDTWSTAANGGTVFENDWGTAVIAHNLIVHSSSAEYYSTNSVGLRVYDEQVAGDNSAADISVYGNVVINKSYGIRIFNKYVGVDDIGLVKIYNNLFIDNRNGNMNLANPTSHLEGHIYNNTSILYDRTGGTHASDSGVLTTWTIENNAFWTTGGSPTVDADWQTDYVISDPDLPGEPAVNWDGTTYDAIEYTTDLYPTVGSSLVASGKDLSVLSYEETFLTSGSDFSDVLSWPTGLDTAEQNDWDIGPWARGVAGTAEDYPLQGVVFSGAAMN